MATWVDFKELRSKLKMAGVLARYNVELKARGDRATGFCPLPGHQSKGNGRRRSPSFSCHLVKGIFQCFSCGAKGNCLDFACLMDGGNPDDPASLRKTALELQKIFGIESSRPSNTRPKTNDSARATARAENTAPSRPIIVNAPLNFELKHLDPEHPYLLSREFTPETIEHFGLGYCSKGMMAGRIAIPLHDAAAKLIGYAGRLVDDDKIDAENPKYRFPGTRERNGTTYEFRKSEFLYNGHRISKPIDDLIVVEGFASVWWLWQNGFKDVLALMGSSCSPEQVRLIIDVLSSDGRIWVLPDADDAGEKCAIDVLSNVAPYRFCRWVRLDAEKQPTDYGPEELTQLIAWRKQT
jgi:DNA primase